MVVLERRTPEGGASRASRIWGSGSELDPDERAVACHRGGRAVVLGAPGTGKTTAVLAAVFDRIDEGVSPDACLVLTPRRSAAAELRDRIATGLSRAATQPLARTPSSLAFALLSARAAAERMPEPRLLSGPEQDVILRELLAGHADGLGRRAAWPDRLAGALATRGFRGELRDLLMRATERDISPSELASLGRRLRRPEWVAAAAVAEEYEDVTALSSPGGYDPAAILGAAADALDADPDLLASVLPGLAVIVMDDAQELTPPGARLVARAASLGADLLLVGDPDAATHSFRGADPQLFTSMAGGGPTYVLRHRWRSSGEPAAVADRVAGRIGVHGSAAHRAPAPAQPEPLPAEAGVDASPRARVLLASTAAEESRHVVQALRNAHLLHDLPWSHMAVIVRGGHRAGGLRRALCAAGVPHAVAGTQGPLREEPVVRALMLLLRVSLSVASSEAQPEPEPLSSDEAYELLTSPLGGMDGLAVRRMRRALRRAAAEVQRRSMGSREATTSLDVSPVAARGAQDVLVAGLLGDGVLDEIGAVGEAPRRLARALTAGARAARREGGRWDRGVSAHSVLWAIWEGLGVAETWRRTAVAGGSAGTWADRCLDAAVALFDAAARYVDRLPGRGPDGFWAHLESQDVAGDSLVVAAPADDAVTLTTPQGAAGREWDLVVVAGVQDGVWPDLRLRGSILGSQDLVEWASGRPPGGPESVRAAIAAVAHDETRLFHVAVTRTRGDLLVTAVAGAEDQPSPFLELVEAGATDPDRPADAAPREITLPGAVAELRRAVVLAATDAQRLAAARRLRLLDARGVRGAHPASWWGLADVSDDRPRRDGGDTLIVSPSHVEALQQCGLRWLFQTSGGDPRTGGGADAVGTLVHAIAAEVDNADPAALHIALDARWPSLGVPDGWVSERRRRLAHDMLSRLARYHAHADAAGWALVGREVTLRAQVGPVTVRGRVDRLERSADGSLRVVDLKTGSSKPRHTDIARHPQLGAYQAMVEEGELADSEASDDPSATLGEQGSGEVGRTRHEAARSGGAALLQLGSAAATTKVDVQVQAALGSDEEPGWAHRLLADAADAMASSTFAASSGPWCRTCRFRASCPASADGKVI
ncbi:MAG: PD-(D/E)XK nuclease family protein [Dermatophilaceae bacterium]